MVQLSLVLNIDGVAINFNRLKDGHAMVFVLGQVEILVLNGILHGGCFIIGVLMVTV